MENKLEIKHLAPYVPYELKVIRLMDGWINSMVWGTSQSGFEISINGLMNTCPVKNMPILLPLSSLTKEITHKGETFVPFEKIAIYKDSAALREDVLTGFVPVIIFNMLCEWHFDVFNLIGDNLAIDVNSLSENPYAK